MSQEAAGGSAARQVEPDGATVRNGALGTQAVPGDAVQPAAGPVDVQATPRAG